MATCRTCGAAIVWTVTDSGKALPIDPHPDPALGNIRIPTGFTPPVAATVYGPDDARRARDGGTQMYVSHFVTCPQADEWRTR